MSGGSVCEWGNRSEQNGVGQGGSEGGREGEGELDRVRERGREIREGELDRGREGGENQTEGGREGESDRMREGGDNHTDQPTSLPACLHYQFKAASKGWVVVVVVVVVVGGLYQSYFCPPSRLSLWCSGRVLMLVNIGGYAVWAGCVLTLTATYTDHNTFHHLALPFLLLGVGVGGLVGNGLITLEAVVVRLLKLGCTSETRLVGWLGVVKGCVCLGGVLAYLSHHYLVLHVQVDRINMAFGNEVLCAVTFFYVMVVVPENPPAIQTPTATTTATPTPRPLPEATPTATTPTAIERAIPTVTAKATGAQRPTAKAIVTAIPTATAIVTATDKPTATPTGTGKAIVTSTPIPTTTTTTRQQYFRFPSVISFTADVADSTAPITAPDVTTVPNTATDVTTAPNTATDVTTAPTTAPDVTTAPNTVTDVTTTATDVTTAPNTATDVTTTATDVTTAPTTAPDVTTAPNTATDVTTDITTATDVTTIATDKTIGDDGRIREKERGEEGRNDKEDGRESVGERMKVIMEERKGGEEEEEEKGEEEEEEEERDRRRQKEEEEEGEEEEEKEEEEKGDEESEVDRRRQKEEEEEGEEGEEKEEEERGDDESEVDRRQKEEEEEEEEKEEEEEAEEEEEQKEEVEMWATPKYLKDKMKWDPHRIFQYVAWRGGGEVIGVMSILLLTSFTSTSSSSSSSGGSGGGRFSYHAFLGVVGGLTTIVAWAVLGSLQPHSKVVPLVPVLGCLSLYLPLASLAVITHLIHPRYVGSAVVLMGSVGLVGEAAGWATVTHLYPLLHCWPGTTFLMLCPLLLLPTFIFGVLFFSIGLRDEYLLSSSSASSSFIPPSSV
ncbi:hypothetical protein Pcinc_012649 [Petrolisthes cinctipes]|uniref:Uncharacterized protein n=1 Tax=Petrolisthes cinctipes TaxID=88211 RepID=A0AAE1KTE8_PETCI|nr:hypothetical protein Pcinc_012649 [Petrolisthes cinctipes]